MGTKSVTASLNPETKESAYIRAGKSTVKTGNQRTISFECDRYLGDEFQDFANSIKYAIGQDAIVNYVYFNILTGKGEKGTATLSLDTDGSGNALDGTLVTDGNDGSLRYTLNGNGVIIVSIGGEGVIPKSWKILATDEPSITIANGAEAVGIALGSNRYSEKITVVGSSSLAFKPSALACN